MLPYFILSLLIGFVAFAILFEQTFLVNQFIITGQVGDTQIFSAIFGVFAFAFLGLVTVATKKFKLPKRISPIFLLLIIWSIFSTFFSKDIGASIFQDLRFFGYFAIFLGAYNLVKADPRFDRFLLVGFAVVASLILLRDLFTFMLSGDLFLGKQFRGSFFWHNQMAGFLLFLSPLLLSLIFYFKRTFHKFLVLLMFVISLFAIIVTYSRGGWLSLLVGLIFFGLVLLRTFKANLRPIILVSVVFLVLLAILSNAPPVKKRINDLRADLSSQKTASGSLRVTVWKNSLAMIKGSPYSGVGPGAFGSAYYEYQQDPWLYARNAHNYFLELGAETGITGLIFFIALLAVVAFGVHKNSNRILDIKKNPLTLGVTVALLASLVHATLDVDFSRISLFVIFWVFLAILVFNLPPQEKVIKLKNTGRLLYLPIFLLIGVSLALLVSEKKYLDSQKELTRGSAENAQNKLETAIKLSPFDSRLYLLSGKIDEIQGKLQEAKSNYLKSFNLSPFRSSPLYRLAITALREGDLEKTKELLKEAIELNKYSDPNYYAVFADVYVEENNLGSARMLLESAIYDRFPIDDVFSQIEHRYNLTGFKKDLAGLYLRLIDLELRESRQDEAEKLLSILEADVDPQNSEIPKIKKYLGD